MKRAATSHDRTLHAALVAHAHGRIAEAEGLYRDALANRPDDAVAAHHMGLLYCQKREYVAAEDLVRTSIALDSGNAEAHNNLGSILRERGRLNEAMLAYREAVRLNPHYAEALYNVGAVHSAQGRLGDAIDAFRKAIAVNAGYAEAHFGLGVALMNDKKPAEAAAAYRRVVALRPDASEGHFNLAVALTAERELDEAIAAYRQAIALRPGFPEAFLNLGVLLRERGLADEAVAVCREGAAANSDIPELHFNLGVTVAAYGMLDEAVAAYRRAIALRPNFPEPHCGLGLVLAAQRRLEEAVDAYRQAIALRPDFYEAHLNLGVALRELGKLDEAIEASKQVVVLRPDNVDALVNLGTLLRDQWRLEEAADAYRRAVEIDPHAVKAVAQLALLRRQICDWSEEKGDTSRVLAFHRDVEPFVLFTMPSSPAQQLASARTWASKFVRGRSFAHTPARRRDRIRIGYLSADFHRHATAYLMAELFERHNRSRFEVIGYSYGPDDGSEMRQRLAASFEHFVDLSPASHADAARRIHADEIDILVDLKGYTGSTRTEIIVDRPAAIQVNYLGFPGTMGADFIDYIIADRFVAPMEQEQVFSEKIVHLAHCYQPNDTKRAIADWAPSRSECGLPEQGMVFCSFNGAYKITPHVFDIWMRLLKAVPGSVLWLLSTNALTEGNLRREAAARAVDPARLVFCPPLHLPQHLARHRNADLFLDTLPVNAHTTASDALWAGLPLLTCMGDTFISRVAGSLLHAVGLPELVTTSLGEYEALALDLATNRDKLGALREKLAHRRLHSPLFDIARFTRAIEAAYERMHEIRLAGQEPRGFAVTDP